MKCQVCNIFANFLFCRISTCIGGVLSSHEVSTIQCPCLFFKNLNDWNIKVINCLCLIQFSLPKKYINDGINKILGLDLGYDMDVKNLWYSQSTSKDFTFFVKFQKSIKVQLKRFISSSLKMIDFTHNPKMNGHLIKKIWLIHINVKTTGQFVLPIS